MSAIRSIGRLILVLSLLVTLSVNAQIEDISMNKEVHIDRIYMGLLSNSRFSNRTLSGTISSLQTGSRIRLNLFSDMVQLRAFGVLKLSDGQKRQFFKSYEVIISPNARTFVHFGLMATPTTGLRPNPTTWQSQIETNAEKSILGGKPGIKIKYHHSDNLLYSYGLHKHDGQMIHHLKVKYKEWSLSTYLEDGHSFFATKWNYSHGNLILSKFKNQSWLSSIIPMSRTFKFFVDLQYNSRLKRMTYSELGLRKQFLKNRFIKGILLLSYKHLSRSLEGGLFIHI